MDSKKGKKKIYFTTCKLNDKKETVEVKTSSDWKSGISKFKRRKYKS